MSDTPGALTPGGKSSSSLGSLNGLTAAAFSGLRRCRCSGTDGSRFQRHRASVRSTHEVDDVASTVTLCCE